MTTPVQKVYDKIREKEGLFEKFIECQETFSEKQDEEGESLIIVDDLTKLSMEDGLSCRNTILAYGLPEWQLAMLAEISDRISKGRLKLCVSNCFTDLYAVPHFLAFLNFAGVQPEEQAAYREFLKEAAELFELDGERIGGLPPTYIFNCDLRQGKIANVMVNSCIFAEPEKLRLTLLQEIKNIEGRGQACENSMRLERVLDIYGQLFYCGAVAKGDVLAEGGTYMFKRDIQSIQAFDSAVRYDAKQKKYVLSEAARDSGDAAGQLLQGASRLTRLLWLYRHLLTKGSFSKEAADRLLGQQLSMRTFLRDVKVIRYTQYGRCLEYDRVKKKYVLPEFQSPEDAGGNGEGR